VWVQMLVLRMHTPTYITTIAAAAAAAAAARKGVRLEPSEWGLQ